MKNAPFLRAGIFLAIFFAAVTIGYFLLRPSDELPIYHPSQLDVRLVDRSVRDAKGEHHIKPFRLIDQDGDSLFLADVQGKVLLTDFFFTTCGTICPKMSSQLARVQE
ncbi:MAG TPA: SCO family protein, partial [Flavobacteriales bacterium]|nr:SCO family protein [Flavobacteriales bacterium]